MPKQGNRRKKTRTHVEETQEQKDYEEAPKCFVIKRGKVGLFM